MKLILSVVLSVFVFAASAQWTNTNNTFKDSLHMPVTTVLNIQLHPVVLNSYPDGGYFIIWEDNRNTATNGTDIYAQKYDKDGNHLWAADGIPIASDTYNEHYTFSSNSDYRAHNHAATDSSGGFYIAYSSDSSAYAWERLLVQHVRGNGTNLFPAGNIIARSPSPGGAMMTQLIADGNKGFFVAYKRVLGSNEYVYMDCYKDEGGTLKYYGGGRANENAWQLPATGPCGNYSTIVFPIIQVSEFTIWSDQYGGCNVAMSMNGNVAGQGKMLGYNRLWRAKKNSIVKTYTRNTSGASCPRTTEYQKDDVYLLYVLHTDFQDVRCGASPGNIYEYTSYRVLSNGYQVIDNKGYDYNYAKGVTMTSTTGKINADLIAVVRRTYANNTVSPFMVYGYAYPSEKFDSVPYQRCSYNNPDMGFNPTPVTNLQKLNNFRDTLLGASSYFPDFSLATGANEIFLGKDAYIAGLTGTSGSRTVRLQHLTFQRYNTDSFALDYKQDRDNPYNKNGVAIGAEISSSDGTITYDVPQVAFNNSGTALFYVREYYRATRVSPISGVAQLTWGAMGRPIGYGSYNNGYYVTDQPVTVLDQAGNSALLAWKDQRFLGTNTADNIYMRHLDSLRVPVYTPPLNKIYPVSNAAGATTVTANPAILLGTSKTFSLIESSFNLSNAVSTPVASILDTNNLGHLVVKILNKPGAARVYNGQAYLNRNLTFKADTIPAKAVIDMKLYFSKQEYDLLKTADPTIKDISYLQVVRQPNDTGTPPDTYTPVAGEEVLMPVAIDSLDGGYSLEINTGSLGNFFIQKNASVNLCATGNRSLVSNVTGATYQWQVNTGGSSFTNISNGGNYSGATTATLQIKNIPTSFNGYRYKCIVAGSKTSNVFYLGIDNRWTGAVSNLWENAANWSCGKVPDATTDVVIQAGTIKVNSAAVCRSLSISTGVQLTVTPGFSLKLMH